MTKLRVYELAKELEMANKELLERIGSLGIQVKGHMSSLDKEQAKLVRDMVEGRSRQLIEEKRVRRGVIRRRRKIVQTEPAPQPVEIEAKVETPPPADVTPEAEVEVVPPIDTPADEESPTPLVLFTLLLSYPHIIRTPGDQSAARTNLGPSIIETVRIEFCCLFLFRTILPFFCLYWFVTYFSGDS